MGRYDNSVKELCGLDPAGICWLLGLPVGDSARVVRHSESVSAATRQVDALVTIDGRVAHHIEFQAGRERHFPFRMLDYRLRLHRLPELAGIEIVQHVVMLGRGTIDDRWRDGQLDYGFGVHYLRDRPVEPLLADVRLAPFASLADLRDDDHRAQTLRAVLDSITLVSDVPTREVLARAATDLAGIYLDRTTINMTWRESAMPFPSIIQQTYDEALEEGREQGLEQGRAVIGSMLRLRFGPNARIPAVARYLATLAPDDCAARLAAAVSLDELAPPSA